MSAIHTKCRKSNDNITIAFLAVLKKKFENIRDLRAGMTG